MDDRLSGHASNACIYTTLSVFLIIGVVVGYLRRKKGEFYAGARNRTGFPLALNFLATGLGSSVLTTYPQAAAMSGLHGCLVYAISTALPMFAFSFLGPRLRRSRPEGFVLTEWVRARYGTICGFVFSGCTILTVYLFSCAELSNLRYGIRSLTGLNGNLVLYIEALVVAMYLAQGGFTTSFFTDNVQTGVFLVLAGVSVIAMGVNFRIDSDVVANSDLLKPKKIGWKMLYMLLIESFTNDVLLAGFWLRTFAAKDNRQLLIGCAIAAAMLFILCTLAGFAGLLAVWSGIVDERSTNLYQDSEYAFFEVLLPMPAWVHGFALVLLMSLSCCTFDSYTSSLITTISNDLCRNKVRMIHMRALTFIMMVPIVALALESPNILSLCDLLASAIVPVLFLGIWDRFYWLSGFEILSSLLGGILTVYIFGCIYYDDASGGSRLLVLNDGIYRDDWGAFGIFVAGPIGSYIGAIVGLTIRWIYFWYTRGRIWAVFDRGHPHWDWRFDKFMVTRWHKIKKPRIWYALVWFFMIPPKEVSTYNELGVTPYADSTLQDDNQSTKSDSWIHHFKHKQRRPHLKRHNTH